MALYINTTKVGSTAYMGTTKLNKIKFNGTEVWTGIPSWYTAVKNASGMVTSAQWLTFLENGGISLAISLNDVNSFKGKIVNIPVNMDNPSYNYSGGWEIADFSSSDNSAIMFSKKIHYSGTYNIYGETTNNYGSSNYRTQATNVGNDIASDIRAHCKKLYNNDILIGITSDEVLGTNRYSIFANASDRMKYYQNETTARKYWTRSGNVTIVKPDGTQGVSYLGNQESCGYVFKMIMS